MKETTARHDVLLNSYQRWLSDLTSIAIKNGMCHPHIQFSHGLTLSTLYFPGTGAVTAVVPQSLYRMIYGKTRPDPLSIQRDFLISLDINTELLFTHVGLEGILLSECARLKQNHLASKLRSLLTRVRSSELRQKLIWLCWYDLMMGTPADDWLDILALADDEQITTWLIHRQEENTVLTALMDEYVMFMHY
ncbi:hypothetical protein P7T24_000655 [Salmonella enterica subsp. enterica serovar Muenster]|uniref:Malate transporter n=4 Tax=Salmonella enterica TaxID=28901 RepID=A0A613PAG2_SALER|nr:MULTISPECIES: hypothetical protein [Salmonella]EAB5795647.1 hypothetical protein [Salmonella enterica subsp. enterica serovar Butantan]EAB7441207.1 hypothetical protein [Salmonella enterica subsp. enterica serovar Anatum]EBC9965981.1 hypothetical protein [Salmonella enterica subsp. enterica serovar Kentucky]EBH9922735.1 hypothetical protein [Salmonella enterica subsp. enterica serovar London]EBW6048067.1 hypothetical protein [Salmonella enterica subsp. enterica serovar Ughelli]ECM7242167.1